MYFKIAELDRAFYDYLRRELVKNNYLPDISVLSKTDYISQIKSMTETQKVIDEVDSRRLKYTTSLIEKIGYTKSESITKAEIFYKYLIGYHEMIKNKKQPKNYLEQVKKELRHFLNI